MDETEGERSMHNQNTPRVLETAQLVETKFINYSYVLDLTPSSNPRFYELDTNIADAIQDPSDLQEVVQCINDLAPDTGHPEEFNKVKQMQSNTIPIDSFFSETDPAAQCLERTLLTQLVLATKGVDTSILAYRHKEGDSFVMHAVLEVAGKVGEPQVIDSYVQVRDQHNEVQTTITPKNDYEKRLKDKGADMFVQIDSVIPNVFSPKKMGD